MLKTTDIENTLVVEMKRKMKRNMKSETTTKLKKFQNL